MRQQHKKTTSTQAEVDDRNKATEQRQLFAWSLGPREDVMYYDEKKKIVTTWLGTMTGEIMRQQVSRHNFGGRMISMAVLGTNGAWYHGRASYDHGTCIRLRKYQD